MQNAMTANQYNETAISSLKGAQRVREKPEVIFGSRDLEGCIHAFFEILSNSVDEARAGFGKIINVTAYADRSIEVEDFGRGIPLGYNENEKRYNWDLIFCELYAGGKYKGSKDSAMYEYALNVLPNLCTLNHITEKHFPRLILLSVSLLPSLG